MSPSLAKHSYVNEDVQRKRPAWVSRSGGAVSTRCGRARDTRWPLLCTYETILRTITAHLAYIMTAVQLFISCISICLGPFSILRYSSPLLTAVLLRSMPVRSPSKDRSSPHVGLVAVGTVEQVPLPLPVVIPRSNVHTSSIVENRSSGRSARHLPASREMSCSATVPSWLQ